MKTPTINANSLTSSELRRLADQKEQEEMKALRGEPKTAVTNKTLFLDQEGYNDHLLTEAQMRKEVEDFVKNFLPIPKGTVLTQSTDPLSEAWVNNALDIEIYPYDNHKQCLMMV